MLLAQKELLGNMTAKSPRLSVSLTPKQADELQRLADQSHVSCSWVARQAILEFLERYDGSAVVTRLPMTKGTD